MEWRWGRWPRMRLRTLAAVVAVAVVEVQVAAAVVAAMVAAVVAVAAVAAVAAKQTISCMATQTSAGLAAVDGGPHRVAAQDPAMEASTLPLRTPPLLDRLRRHGDRPLRPIHRFPSPWVHPLREADLQDRRHPAQEAPGVDHSVAQQVAYQVAHRERHAAGTTVATATAATATAVLPPLAASAARPPPADSAAVATPRTAAQPAPVATTARVPSPLAAMRPAPRRFEGKAGSNLCRRPGWGGGDRPSSSSSRHAVWAVQTVLTWPDRLSPRAPTRRGSTPRMGRRRRSCAPRRTAALG